MKRKILYLFSCFTLFIGMTNVEAKANVTATSQAYTNSTFRATISISGVSMWEVHMSSSGPVKNCSFDDVNYTSTGSNGSKTYSITCKTTASTGTVKLTLTGKTITESGSQATISDTATVRIVERPKETPKSSVNTLDNLWVDGVELSPSYNKDTTEYTVELESDVTSINIGTKKSDSKSSVSGDGNRSVSEGVNTLEIKVTAENGSTRTYVIKANVKEKEPINVTVNGQTYTVIRKREDLKEVSELYIETTVKMNEEEIPAYYGETSKLTLVGLKDNEGNIENYIYDESNKAYTLYQEVNSQKITIYPVSKTETKVPVKAIEEEIEINERKVKAYKPEKSDYYLIYAMNIEKGTYTWYQYDKEEGTFQRFMQTEGNLTWNEQVKAIFIGIASVFAILLAAIIALLTRIRRYRKKIKTI